MKVQFVVQTDIDIGRIESSLQREYDITCIPRVGESVYFQQTRVQAIVIRIVHLIDDNLVSIYIKEIK